MELLPALTTALLSASLVSLVLLDATSIHLVVQKLQLYAYGWLLMVLGRDKRWRALKLKRAMLHRMEGVTSKRLILMRHGESEWNLIFNVGSKLLVPFKATVALWREAKMLLHLDMGSVLYDSPLNEAGLEQAQEIAELLRDEVVTSGDVAILRGSPGALTSVLATSNLRRAAQTVAVALHRPAFDGRPDRHRRDSDVARPMESHQRPGAGRAAAAHRGRPVGRTASRAQRAVHRTACTCSRRSRRYPQTSTPSPSQSPSSRPCSRALQRCSSRRRFSTRRPTLATSASAATASSAS